MPANSIQSDTIGHCRWCGARVGAGSFRDIDSYREYQVAAACQACQDEMYLGTSEGSLLPHPVRHGVIVGAVTAGDCLHEVALLPFLFIVPSARIVWEPRYLLRAGSATHPVDPWVELAAMRDEWRDYNIRTLCIPAPHQSHRVRRAR